MSRVLVTGATGFIGRRALAPLHERGFEVHAVARRRGGAGDMIHWHTADLLDPAQRRAVVDEVGATHLLHLAWYVEHGRFWTALENAHWVGATTALLEAFAGAGGQRAVLAGTAAEYDWTAGGRCVEGETPLRPATLYGVCKDATRRICEALSGQLGLGLAWGRVFLLYGPGEDDRRLVASVARALATGERAPTSAGTQLRDFLHVDDVAAAFAALVASEVSGAVNIGSGEAVAVREVVETVARALGREDLLDFGALPMSPGEPPELVPAVRRLREEVGFTPAVGLVAGIAATVSRQAAQAQWPSSASP